MLVLGIETTCDETAVAIVRDGREILVNLVASQEVHENFGGVVPELACRRHIEVLRPLVEQARSIVPLSSIDLIAVAYAPGLIGPLLIGLNFAKTLSLATSIPFVGVNHVEAHLYAAMMDSVPLPALGVVLSGGHTELLMIQALGSYRPIGKTHDDAIGEAFDKAARLLDLPYPGGPQIEQLALEGSPSITFKPAIVKGYPYAFSFSGLKTALLYRIRGQNGKSPTSTLSRQEKADLAASFQEAAFATVCDKIIRASQEFSPHCIVLGGGVTANRRLREKLAEALSLPLLFPPPGLSLDNGAMIAGLGYHIFNQRGADRHDLLPCSRVDFATH